MWYFIFEVPSGLLLFGLVLIMALSDSAGKWVLENVGLITAFAYIAEAIMGGLRCYRYKKQNISLWITIPLTIISFVASTQYLMKILVDIAVVASGGVMGLIGLVVAAPLAILSCVIVKAPAVFVNTLAKDREISVGLVVADAVITVALTLLCSWFYGYI